MSLSAAALQIMMDKGLSLSDVVEIAKVIEADAAPVSAEPTVGALRTRRYRERLTATGLSAEEWRRLSLRIISRDKATCQYCNTTKGKMQCDHIVPLIQGGGNEDANLVCACAACNGGKAGRTIEQWRGEEWATTWKNHRVMSRDVTSEQQRVSPTPPSEIPPIPPLKGGTFPQTDQPSLAKPLPAEPQKTITAWVSEIWEITPRPGRERSGKRNLENALKAAQRRGEDLGSVKAGLVGYFASPDATKADGQFCQGVHVVVSSGRWEAFAGSDPPSTADPPDPWRQRMTRWKHARYWDSEWGPKPGKPGCLAPEAYLEEQAA